MMSYWRCNEEAHPGGLWGEGQASAVGAPACMPALAPCMRGRERFAAVLLPPATPRALGQVSPQLSSCAPLADRAAENRHVKSIVRTECALQSSVDPHHFLYRDNPECQPADSAHRYAPGPKTDAPLLKRIALYHYAVKSIGALPCLWVDGVDVCGLRAPGGVPGMQAASVLPGWQAAGC